MLGLVEVGEQWYTQEPGMEGGKEVSILSWLTILVLTRLSKGLHPAQQRECNG